MWPHPTGKVTCFSCIWAPRLLCTEGPFHFRYIILPVCLSYFVQPQCGLFLNVLLLLQSFVQSVSNLLMEENRERWEEAQLVSIAPSLRMRIYTVTPSVIISLQMRTVIITVLNPLNWRVRHRNKGPGGQTAHLYFFSHWQRYKERWEEKGRWTEIALAMTNPANVSAHSSICRTHLLVPHCLCFCPAVRSFHRCVTILATEVCQANQWGGVFTLDAKKTLVFKKQNGYSSSRNSFYHQLSKSHCFYRFFCFYFWPRSSTLWFAWIPILSHCWPIICMPFS